MARAGVGSSGVVVVYCAAGDSSRGERQARTVSRGHPMIGARRALWRSFTFAAALALGMAAPVATPAVLAQNASPPAADAPPPLLPPKAEHKPQPGDAFAEEVTLTPKTIIYLKGNTTLDKALETLQDAFKSLDTLVDKQGLVRAGNPMTIYSYPDDPDDLSFSFQAAIPIAAPPKDLPKGDIQIGQSPGGKALKFVYRGSYDAMEDIYEPIASYLDEKQIDVQNIHIEEYATDLATTPDDKLVVTIYVLPKTGQQPAKPDAK
jgi:effector-binding domain-containing protein